MHDALLEEMSALVSQELHPLTNLANAAALLWQRLPDINWAGFYLLHSGKLWLGPFQGKPACTSIDLGRGVCGTAFDENRTVRVPDVHAFPGHIACDAASRSELVTVLRHEGRPIGVLDIDSPRPGRFTPADERLIEAIASLLDAACDYAALSYQTTEHKETK